MMPVEVCSVAPMHLTSAQDRIRPFSITTSYLDVHDAFRVCNIAVSFPKDRFMIVNQITTSHADYSRASPSSL